MPAPAHIRLTYSGVFGSVTTALEIWSFNVSMGAPATPGGPTGAALQTLANSAQAAFASLAPGITGQAVLTRTRAALVGPDGHVDRPGGGAYSQADNTTTTTGSSGLPFVPLSTTLAVTLHSAAAGATGRGRFYLPTPLISSLDADGRISTSTQTAHVTRVRAFLNALNTAGAASPTTGLVVCVASGGSVAHGIAPALRPVTQVSVGKVLDVQRRRRGKQPEDRVLTNL